MAVHPLNKNARPQWPETLSWEVVSHGPMFIRNRWYKHHAQAERALHNEIERAKRHSGRETMVFLRNLGAQGTYEAIIVDNAGYSYSIKLLQSRWGK